MLLKEHPFIIYKKPNISLQTINYFGEGEKKKEKSLF